MVSIGPTQVCPERVGESPAERVGPSRPTPHRSSRPSSAPSTDLPRPRPLDVHAIPPLPLCGFSVDELIGRSTPHCRALRTVGDLSLIHISEPTRRTPIS